MDNFSNMQIELSDKKIYLSFMYRCAHIYFETVITIEEIIEFIRLNEKCNTSASIIIGKFGKSEVSIYITKETFQFMIDCNESESNFGLSFGLWIDKNHVTELISYLLNTNKNIISR